MAAAQLQIDLPTAIAQMRIWATDGPNEVAQIRGGWMPPLTEPQVPLLEFVHDERRSEPGDLAGLAGELIADSFQAEHLQLIREVWRADDGLTLAIRHRVRNKGSEAIVLRALLPLRCDGPASLLVEGADADGWEVLVQKRYKNDCPTSFRPGVLDDDVKMAVRPVGPTGEPLADHGDEITEVRADPFCLIRRAGSSHALLIGYLSQGDHLARIVLQFANEPAGAQLEHLTAECELDGIRFDPGEDQTSQWLLIRTGDANELMAFIADSVGRFHGIDPPSGQPPSVWCSFYVYGEYYAESYFEEDLEDLEVRPVPFDVFLIDGGWEKCRGDWRPRDDWWPSGLRSLSDRIRELGYRPGLWTAPYIINHEAPVAIEHPEWMARNADGGHQDYMGYILDTTHPGACDYLENLYRRLTFEEGFDFHKFDFMRGIFNDPDIRFHDPKATRLEAYRRGLAAIRRGTGPDAYICVCGGHFGGSLGLADSQRSGSDVRAMWDVMKPRLKQPIMRTWMSRLWHVDADAMLLRRREEPLLDNNHGVYSLGKLTDDEVSLVALTQYLSGQLVTLAEKFTELDEDRRALMRHVFPSLDAPAVPLNPFEPVAPSQLVTRIKPRCRSLGRWSTLAIINWDDEPKRMDTTLSRDVVGELKEERFLVTEFFSGNCFGLLARDERLDIGEVPAHSCRLLRIAPWDGRHPILAGTDLSFSGGGIEVAEWSVRAGQVAGRIETDWDYPVNVVVAIPDGEGYRL